MTCSKRLFALLLMFVIALPVTKAAAHNLNVFAMSNGDTIEGYVYFTGGTRTKQAQIELHDGNDNVLLKTTTDDEGNFALRVSHQTNYVVFTDTGDGHVAKFRLYAEDFAENLPVATKDTLIAVTALHQGEQKSSPTDTLMVSASDNITNQSAPDLAGLSRDELTQLVNHAVARQVGPLREEVNAYRNDVRMSDIMGGIGIIIGIFGFGAWVVARRQART
jgi:hypothetical protein